MVALQICWLFSQTTELYVIPFGKNSKMRKAQIKILVNGFGDSLATLKHLGPH